jgi:PTS system cellobiose-specific IIA component
MTKQAEAGTVEIATTVILHAGNARNMIVNALNAAYDEDFAAAKEFINQAETELRSAHRTQTEYIQAEARGVKLEITLLVNHAQDTLMVAMAELNLAKQMLRMYQKFSAR